VLVQEYDRYTPDDFAVWETLFERQNNLIGDRICSEYRHALDLVEFSAGQIPRMERIDAILGSTTGWRTVVVPGILPDAEFFQLLAERRFPATTWLRRRDQLDYLEEPDMFHDVFGHIPLLTHPQYTGFLEGLGHIALQYIQDAAMVEYITRLYWFTVEFGLIREAGDVRIFGAGIVSSVGESQYCLRPDSPARVQPFDLDRILDSPFRKDVFQEQYFIAEGYEQLLACLPVLEERLRERAVVG
jgi:phenylalanine-4-hydroxylase